MTLLAYIYIYVVCLLLAALKLMHIRILLRPEPRDDGVVGGLQGLRAVLPELAEGQPGRSAAGRNRGVRRRAHPRPFDVAILKPVSAERDRDLASVIHVDGTRPVLSSTRVLVEGHRAQ